MCQIESLHQYKVISILNNFYQNFEIVYFVSFIYEFLQNVLIPALFF